MDTGIITKYARMYLNTYFDRVMTVKGTTVADFRVMWGVQDEYEKKERVNHIHHCLDAITMACMTKDNYEQMAKFYHDWEEAYNAGHDAKPKIDKPWPSFTEDLKEIENEVLVSHYTPDNLPKPAKRKLRIRGRIVKNSDGKPVYIKGDSARGSLHMDTNYGAIKRPFLDKEGNQIDKLLYVARKPLDSIKPNDLNNIVDEQIRKIVSEGKTKEEPLKKELEKWIKLEKEEDDPVRKAQFKEKVDSLKNQIMSLFRIENEDGSFTPIKKVRCIATNVTNPLDIKNHRDQSKHEYKQFSHFANESNYVMGIYEGVDGKGKIKRDFILVNNLDAAKYYNGKMKEDPLPEIHPKTGIRIKFLLKSGTMVILKENNDDEIWSKDVKELAQRLNKIIGLSVMKLLRDSGKIDEYGVLVMKHVNEARPGIDMKIKSGTYKIDESYVALRRLYHTQFDALVEGFDFYLSPIGEIKKIEK